MSLPHDSSSEVFADVSHDRPQWTVPLRRVQMVFIRAIVWSLVGLLYAPLFLGLVEIQRTLGVGSGAYVVAAVSASAVVALLYGAREVALIGTGVGVATGIGLLMIFSENVTLVDASLIAAALAVVVGMLVSFPARCARHVAGKMVAGLVSGLMVGGVAALAEPLHPQTFSIFGVVAFVISVNGVWYVASVKGWVALIQSLSVHSRACYVVEALVMALLAGIAAGSVWMVSGPLLALGSGWWWDASVAFHRDILQALAAGAFGGALTGILLESFRFPWVNDL